MFAKLVLNKKGSAVSKFKNNLPGLDWAYSLLNRLKNELSQNIATNIKKTRSSGSAHLSNRTGKSLTCMRKICSKSKTLLPLKPHSLPVNEVNIANANQVCHESIYILRTNIKRQPTT